MANLGNVGHAIAVPSTAIGAWAFYTNDKRPVSVVMHGVSDIPFAYAVLTRNSVVQYRTRCDGSGNWNFYDMDDSNSQVYSISTYTQAGAVGEAWTATVVGSVATVTKTFSSQRATAMAFA